MSDKHIIYHKVLEALGETGCPVCRLVDTSIREQMKWMLYESVNDPGIRKRLAASRGFCREHSGTLLEIGHPLGVAIIYRDMIDAVSDDLSGRPKRRLRKQLAECPACEWVEENEKKYLSVLAEHLGDQQVQSRLRECRGLCVPHIEGLLGMLRSAHQTEFRELVLAHLSALRDELLEIIRKSDYRCDEPFGSEGDAWIRAVRKITGWPGKEERKR